MYLRINHEKGVHTILSNTINELFWPNFKIKDNLL